MQYNQKFCYVIQIVNYAKWLVNLKFIIINNCVV